jgi:diguanylate cyclase (GGDEF)-like protein
MIDHIRQLESDIVDAHNTRERIDRLNRLAWILRNIDKSRGAEVAQRAYDLAQAAQYPQGIADGLLSLCQYNHTDYVLALSQALQALAIFEDSGHQAGQARALFTLCWVHWSLDNFVEAVEAGQRALELARSISDLDLQADILNNLGLAYKRSGNYEAGYAAYAEALATSRTLGNHLIEAKVLTNLALAHIAQEQYAQAQTYAEQAWATGVENPLINGYTFLAIGQAYRGMQQPDQANNYLDKALNVGRTHAISQLSLQAMLARSQICIAAGSFTQAITILHEALTLADQAGSDLYRSQCHELLSQIYETQGDLAQAFAHFKQFHRIREILYNDTNNGRLQSLEIFHRTEMARREAEIYQLRNIELEREISERRKTEQLLAQQATTDMLTGIANRRHFFSMAAHELNRAARTGDPLAVAIIDIDHFKQINDGHGHAAGDQALITFVQIVQRNVRVIDIFARLGGDEFVVLLPSTSTEQARAVMERIRRDLLEQQLTIGSTSITLTISAGIAGLEQVEGTLESLLAHADAALYLAKAAGRNQVCVA